MVPTTLPMPSVSPLHALVARYLEANHPTGPWAAVYETYQSGAVNTSSPTPVWFLIIAGLLLGAGFWFYGYNIMRAMGNKITQMSPTRGFAVELGAAVTVLLASRLGLPVSTTQCLTGSALGVALMNFDLGAVNWRQLAFIFMGWVSRIPFQVQWLVTNSVRWSRCLALVSSLACSASWR
jgi:phosphate/sulfate permease